eukprot:4218654-Prymnesium_polylepis.1
MGPDHPAWAGRMHALEGWLGSTGVTHILILPEAVIAPGAPKTAATRGAGGISAGRAHTSNEQARRESKRPSMRHMVDQLPVPSPPADQARVPAAMEEGPGSASDDSWSKVVFGAAHLLHGLSGGRRCIG